MSNRNINNINLYKNYKKSLNITIYNLNLIV